MGQKTNPIGLRLGVNRTWDSIWYDEKHFAEKLHEDIIIRNYISKKLKAKLPVFCNSLKKDSIEKFYISKKGYINFRYLTLIEKLV